MPKGPIIPDWMKLHIVETYQRMEEETGTPPTGPQVHQRVLEIQSRRNRPVPLPSLRSVQLALTKARPGLGLKKDVDRPWSLGSSADYGLSPEATQDLLDLQMWCILTGRTLTIRQAIWADRLRTVCFRKEDIPILLDGGTHGLYRWAYRYALRERASRALDLPSIDTSDLDGELISRSE